ncbi:hypothetical protein INT48_001174, partial [Thamnidium elegans]
FVSLMEEIESLVNEKQHQYLKDFARYHKNDDYSIHEDKTCLQYFKTLKSQAIFRGYETATYNRESLASGTAVKVTEDIFNEFNKRSNSPKLNQGTKTRRVYDSDDSEEEVVIYKKKSISIWELWEKLILKMKTGDMHEYKVTVAFILNSWAKTLYTSKLKRSKRFSRGKYSLERLHIIQIGSLISSAQTRKYYPRELVEEDYIIVESVPNYITTSINIHNNIMYSMTTNIKTTKALLANLTRTIFASEVFLLRFSFDVYKVFAHELYNIDKGIYDDEESLNHRFFFWPICGSLCKEELSLLHDDHTHFYNADGVITDRDLNIEFAMLETVGPLNLINNAKETKDFIKTGYGVLSMLHRIGRSFRFGDFGLFKKCSIYFIQVTPIKEV